MSCSPPRVPHGDRHLQKRTRRIAVLAAFSLFAGGAALAQAQASLAAESDLTPTTVPEPSPPVATPGAEAPPPRGFAHDAGLYFTAPLHWNGSDWAWFAAG